ncbi:MAG: FadR family transcriptional regulator [Spirochaetes bacterium]|nr:FadR family transcriptional regulator [Spirochaetota bacterium]
MFLEPLKTDSLVEAFVKRFEELIISGKLTIGQKIPSERELAKKLGVSRPVVHEGLIILEQKGLVSIRPRHGVTVSDYRTRGSLAILQSLITYGRGQLEPHILESLLATRKLIELETVRLAAVNRTNEQLDEFNAIVTEEQSLVPSQTHIIVDVDFKFHHLIALASGNVVYPLLLNSFKQVYTNLTYQFFLDPDVVSFVFAHHQKLAGAIAKKDSKKAVAIMTALLEHGELHLKNYITKQHSKEAL